MSEVIHSHPAGWWGLGMTVDNSQEALIIQVKVYSFLLKLTNMGVRRKYNVSFGN
ncbi:MAG: hypothetical protein NT178_17945 [Proteobacteria bacterium]|nr:hypothetical protein [Pseudomonadota bacterium]